MGVSTVIVEPRFLVREALVSLLADKGYRTVGMDSAADAENAPRLADAPRLVILGPRPTDEVASIAGSIRRLWRDAKIVLLFDQEPSTDFSKLLASEIDGCIPLFASPGELVDALERILLAGDLRILILKAGRGSSPPCPTDRQEEGHALGLMPNAPIQSDDVKTQVVDRTSSVRVTYGLSQRHEEILIGLTKGHSNKMIARTCGITEATIKVHMKSVLQKIRALNRTQAAIWALEKGYGDDAHRLSPAAHLHVAAAA